MEQLNLIIDTYQRIILESESKLAKVKQHIYRIGTLRLILFAAGIAGIIYFWDEGRLVIGGIAAITFIPFILLVHHIFILMIWTYLENIHSFST